MVKETVQFMKKILLASASALVIGYFFHTQKPTSTVDTAWEETLDSIATTQVEEMFLLLNVYNPQEWVRFEKVYYDKNSWETHRIKLQPLNDWGRFVDLSTSESMLYRCSLCNDGVCFSDEIRVRWYIDAPHIRLKRDYHLNQEFRNSCEGGRYYMYPSFKSFCLDLIDRAEKINEVIFCDYCDVVF